MSEWFYSSKGAQAGPVGQAELAKLAAAGTLKPTDLVWRDGIGDWIPAAKVRGLFPEAVPASAPAAPVAVPTAPQPQRPAAAQAGAPATAPASVLPYVGGGGTSSYDAGVTERTVTLLGHTRPWVLFLSVFGFIMAGLFVLGMVIMLFASMMGPATAGAGSVGPIGVIAAAFYAAGALFFFFLALYLVRYAGRIARLRASRSASDLEAALDAQRAFWRLLGIVVVAGIVVYFALIAVAIGFGMMR